jgi:hypothetical protein
MKNINKNTFIKSSSVLMTCFFMSLTLITRAQNTHCNDHVRVGLNVTNYVNGNGHGSFYNFGAVLNSHRSTISIGPTFQKAKKEFVGAGFTYSFNVVGSNASCISNGDQYNETEELSFFVNVSYYKRATLSSATIESEGKISEETLQYYRSLNFNTLESYAGMCYNRLLGDHLKVKLFIATGYYTHLEFNEVMSHDRGAVVLMTGIGIGFLK